MEEGPDASSPSPLPRFPADAASLFGAATSPVLFDTLDDDPPFSSVEDLQQRWERVPHGACVGGERWLRRAVRANAAERADGPGAADRGPFGLVEATVRGGDPVTA